MPICACCNDEHNVLYDAHCEHCVINITNNLNLSNIEKYTTANNIVFPNVENLLNAK